MRLSPLVFAMLLLLPCVVPAQEKPAEPKPPPRESLRYDGKPFEYWQTYWQTELKAERRVECLRAMGAFGSNGYGAEAAEAIVGIVRTYTEDNTAYRDGVSDAAYRAMKDLGSPGFHALLAHANHPNVCRLARETLAQPGAPAIPANAVPTLAQLAMSAKADERDLALDVIHLQVVGQKQITAALANELAKRNAEEPFLRVLFRNLRGSSNAGAGIFEQPVTSIGAGGATTVGGSFFPFQQPVTTIGGSRSPGIGLPSSEDLLGEMARHSPRLKKIACQLAIAELRELKMARKNEVEKETNGLSSRPDLGSNERAIMAFRLSAFDSQSRRSSVLIVTVLGKMGPAARDALPELREALEDPCVGLQNAARTAIEQITKKQR